MPLDKTLYSNANIFDGNTIHLNYSLAISDGRIMGFGQSSDFKSIEFDHTIDCQGKLITESFIDSHSHILSYASNLTKPHINYQSIKSKSDLINQIENIVKSSREYWIKIYGLQMQDRQIYINKTDLDEISNDVPIVIYLDSLHGNLLNSKALEIIGVTEYTNEPTGITFDRQVQNGKLSGYIFEGDQLIDEYMPKSSSSDLKKSLDKILNLYQQNGYSIINDASITNDLLKFQFLSSICSNKRESPKIVFMPGYPNLHEFSREKLFYKSSIGSLSLGHCKIMLTASSGQCVPDIETLSAQVNKSHMAGFPVAIHAVDNLSVKAAIKAISMNPFENDRIEHASELFDEDIENIKKNNINVSTHPSFIYERGDLYLKEKNHAYINSLYRIGSLINAGITVGYSSDAPVSSINPLIGMYANLNRSTKLGEILNSAEKVCIQNTLKMLTENNKTLTNVKSDRAIRMGENSKMLLIDIDVNNIDDRFLNTINPPIKWIN